MRASYDERGAATVLTVAMLGVLLLTGAALAVVGAIVVAHRQAEAAADLAALAGATAIADRTGADACTAASAVATANAASLRSCQVDGEEVLVQVAVSGPRWLGQDEDLRARARAGPA